ncbi:hypothetical protein BHM03_00038521 [Ensete ventricosum]|uniref:Uncharacterized protein n=1 Tax=Ensete ventricosum TaxID=4639 RepID=A0A445MKB9_ENSVE|nr:hypothetical protein BHM03_00038521 [Ensete ventricosum]
MDAAERRIQSPPVVVFITLTRGGLRRWAESNPMAEPTDWPRAGARYRVAGRRVGLNSAEGGGGDAVEEGVRRHRHRGPPRLLQSEAGEAVPFNG